MLTGQVDFYNSEGSQVLTHHLELSLTESKSGVRYIYCLVRSVAQKRGCSSQKCFGHLFNKYFGYHCDRK